MKFKQSVSQFFVSKTNITGLTSIIGGIVGFYTKTITPIEAVNYIGLGLGFIFVKDAIAGNKK